MTTETTTTVDTTNEMVTVLPAIKVPAHIKDLAEASMAEISSLRPMLEEVHARAIRVRDAYEAALLEYAAKMGDRPSEDIDEAISGATGWGALWSHGQDVIGHLFTDDGDFDHTQYTTQEILRGGERNHTVGTVADVTKPDGTPMRVRVRWVLQPNDTHYVCDEVGGGERAFRCSHEEIRAGLVEHGDPEREGLRRLQAAGLVRGE